MVLNSIFGVFHWNRQRKKIPNYLLILSSSTVFYFWQSSATHTRSTQTTLLCLYAKVIVAKKNPHTVVIMNWSLMTVTNYSFSNGNRSFSFVLDFFPPLSQKIHLSDLIMRKMVDDIRNRNCLPFASIWVHSPRGWAYRNLNIHPSMQNFIVYTF
jgi:hypothetical protein